jgi:branched-chain amino acid transport system ATP-binding protein
MTPGLVVDGLSAGYTAVPVVRGVSLSVAPGEMVALLGPNGAGKTTLLRALAGLLRAAGGRILVDGQDMTRTSVGDRVRSGIVLVAEGRRLFGNMTVEDNLFMGAFLSRDRREVRRRAAEVYDLFPRLRLRRGVLVENLSGGEQQMCAIGTGLMGRPRFLLIDELSLGLAPHLVETLAEKLTTLPARGIGVVLVDQAVDVALEVTGRAYVLEGGQVRLEGTSRDLLSSQALRDSYFGPLAHSPAPGRAGG